jgi:uncharacterized protein YjbI with pentapeptide repeats
VNCRPVSAGTRANLHEADLRSAHGTYARLNNANLTYADLHGANLTGANLERARLPKGFRPHGTKGTPLPDEEDSHADVNSKTYE